MATRTEFAVPPTEEQRLRDACINGDVRAVFRLLNPEDSCFASPAGRIFKQPTLCEQKVPSLDYVYQDDHNTTIPLYLAGARRQLTGMDLLLHWVDRFFYFHRSDHARYDPERAAVLATLFEEGYQLDLSAINTKGQGVIHFCVETNSVHVLRVILRTAFSEGFPTDKLPSLHLKDSQQKCPLDHALEKRRFACIKLLVAAGALAGHLRSSHQSLTQATHLAAMPGSSSGQSLLTSFWNSVADPLKRKEQKMKGFENELLVNEAMDEEGISVKVLENQDSVSAVLFSAIEAVVLSATLDESTAYTLLSQNQYHLTSAMEAAKTFARPVPTEPSSDREPHHCIVCFDEIRPSRGISVVMPCGHITCDACWKGVLQARLSEGDVHQAVCPYPECQFHFPLTHLPSILSQSEADQFMRLLCSRYVDIHRHLRWCPLPDCPRVVSLSDSAKTETPISASCTCGFEFCWKCLKESHEPATCHQAEEWRSALDVIQSEKQSTDWVQSETVPCPRCHSPIERNGGCNHMSCAVCRQQFCYQCGRKWKGHVDHYTCFTTRAPVAERVETAVRVWGILEGIFSKFRQGASRAAYEMHLRQYLTHDLDTQHVTAVGSYMINLLRETLPDEELSQRNGQHSRIQVDLGYLQKMLEVLISSKRILKNSYILGFNLRKGSSRRRFLCKLQEQLEGAVGKLMVHFTTLPGFREIPRDVVVSDRNFRFTTNDAVFVEQFYYCHALHGRRAHVEILCDVVRRLRDDIIRASRLGLICHTKPSDVRIPRSASNRAQ